MREGTRRMGERGGEVGLVRRRRRKMLDDRKGERGFVSVGRRRAG